MSRVGKMPITVPKGVDVTVDGRADQRQGLARHAGRGPVNGLVTVKNEDGKLMFAPANDSAEADAMSGTMRALVANMVGGVTKGFEKKLDAGRRRLPRRRPGQQAQPADRLLAPGRRRTCRPASRSRARRRPRSSSRAPIARRSGQVAAEVRALRPPEPYKGKGIRYLDEKVVIKETKKK